MLIHLGIVHLGQTDRVEISVKRAISMNGREALPERASPQKWRACRPAGRGRAMRIIRPFQ
jgi:hypothetical protein